MKLCRGCGETKPLEAFSKQKNKSNGVQSKCKACFKQYRDANKDRIKALNLRWREENREAWLEGRKRYRQENAEKIYEKNKAYQEANREQVRAWVRKSYWKNHDKELTRNREKYERDKHKLRATRRAWRKANPEKVAGYLSKRRDRVAAAGPEITGPEKLDLLKEHGWKCAYCKVKMDWHSDIEFDHVVPIDSGGLNHKANRVPSCCKCNRRKWKHSLDTFVDSYLTPLEDSFPSSI